MTLTPPTTHQGVNHEIFAALMNGGRLNPYLVLRIRRENIVQDTLQQLVHWYAILHHYTPTTIPSHCTATYHHHRIPPHTATYRHIPPPPPRPPPPPTPLLTSPRTTTPHQP